MKNKRPEWWPACPVPGCKNGKCYALDSEYCYPHTKAKGLLNTMLSTIKTGEDKEKIVGLLNSYPAWEMWDAPE